MEIKIQSGKYVVFVKQTFYDKAGKNPYEGDNVLAAFQTKAEADEYVRSQGSAQEPMVEESQETEVEEVSEGVEVEVIDEDEE